MKPEEPEAATGISSPAPGSCENENNNNKEISHGSLLKLAKFEQANTPLTELHLSDEIVALLKSGRINNRLLCEPATHKDFIKFLINLNLSRLFALTQS